MRVFLVGNTNQCFGFAPSCTNLVSFRSTVFQKLLYTRQPQVLLAFHQISSWTCWDVGVEIPSVFWRHELPQQTSTKSHKKTLERSVTKELRDKGFSRQKGVSESDEVLMWDKRLSYESDEVLSSLSYLCCKLNGKRVSDQRSKCWNSQYELIIHVISIFVANLVFSLVFLTTLPASRGLYSMKKKKENSSTTNAKLIQNRFAFLNKYRILSGFQLQFL